MARKTEALSIKTATKEMEKQAKVYLCSYIYALDECT